jgi:aryl-alcohol dehydrogenase-like predicted oxidoreductase
MLAQERRQLLEAVPRLGEIARDLGGSIAQLALAWTLKNPNVSTAITGASRPQQVEENMKAIDLLEKLDDSVMERIGEILTPLPEG